MAPVLGETINNGRSDQYEDFLLDDLLKDDNIIQTNDDSCPDSPISDCSGALAKENVPKSHIQSVCSKRESSTNSVFESNLDGSVSISSGSIYTTSERVDDDEMSAIDLLEMAHERINNQKLNDQMKSLKHIIREKDEQVVQLTGQLRRATSTKCDLVVACTQIEEQKEMVERRGGLDVKEISRMNLKLLEQRSTMEVEFMNELAKLDYKIEDMDRKHRNEILEKDFENAKLKEEMRKLRASTRKSSKPKQKSVWRNEANRQKVLGHIME